LDKRRGRTGGVHRRTSNRAKHLLQTKNKEKKKNCKGEKKTGSKDQQNRQKRRKTEEGRRQLSAPTIHTQLLGGKKMEKNNIRFPTKTPNGPTYENPCPRARLPRGDHETQREGKKRKVRRREKRNRETPPLGKDMNIPTGRSGRAKKKVFGEKREGNSGGKKQCLRNFWGQKRWRMGGSWNLTLSEVPYAHPKKLSQTDLRKRALVKDLKSKANLIGRRKP